MFKQILNNIVNNINNKYNLEEYNFNIIMCYFSLVIRCYSFLGDFWMVSHHFRNKCQILIRLPESCCCAYPAMSTGCPLMTRSLMQPT